MNKITKTAIVNALLTALYVTAVGSFLHYVPRIFNTPPNTPDTLFVPIAMLLLLVLSAATTGYLIFGKPILWYLDGKKEESVSLLALTLVTLFFITLLALLILFVSSTQ